MMLVLYTSLESRFRVCQGLSVSRRLITETNALTYFDLLERNKSFLAQACKEIFSDHPELQNWRYSLALCGVEHVVTSPYLAHA